MSTITVKNSLRSLIEIASEGKQTIRYTTKGQPSFFNIVEKFDMSEIDSSMSGTHPAFIINGVEKSRILIGTYQGSVVDGELVSQPNKEPTTNMSLSTFVAAANASGNGHHVITNAEWSAIALKAYKSQVMPLGNTYYGQSAEDAQQKGYRVDGLATGTTSARGITYTGSGPASWRTGRTYNGISDMAGNTNEMTSGVRIDRGEIQVLVNNNAAMANVISQEWKCIDGRTGDFITPNGSGTTPYAVRYANSGTADYTLVHTNWAAFAHIANPSPTNPVATVALNKLKALCLFPPTNQFALLGTDGFGFLTSDTRLMVRGGGTADGVASGIFYGNMSLISSGVDANISTRPAFYE